MELIESKHNKQPVMVELATRLHGGVAPALFRECYEPHLLHGLSDLVLCPDKKPENAIFKQHGYVYFHVSTNKGVFQGIPDDEIKKILRLKSVKGINLWISKGDEYQETTDLFTCPAISWLSHPSEIQIKEDVNAIKIILSRYFL